MEEFINKISSGPFGFCRFDRVKDDLIDCRAKSRLPAEAQGIITFLFPYNVGNVECNISKYAFFPDYHRIITDILEKYCLLLKEKFEQYSFVPFVDNSPIPEVKAANMCGLGVIGENGLLINDTYGSFVFIGEIVTDANIKAFKNSDIQSSCLKCGRCEKFCPGQALHGGNVDINTCASYISQKKGLLTDKEKDILLKGNSVWGCDICQNVCPMNIGIPLTDIEEFKEDIVPIIRSGDYEKLSGRAFHWRKSNVIERNIDLFLKNGGI